MKRVYFLIDWILGLLIAGAAFVPGASYALPAAQEEPVHASLLADVASVAPTAKSIPVGIHFKLEEGWHIYWKNPGDVGLPIKVDWNLPPGFQAGQLEWPAPKRILEGDITAFGYESETLLPATIQISAVLTEGQTLSFKAKVGWLVCKEICLPGDAQIALDLPVSSAAGNPASAELFRKTRSALPAVSTDWLLQAAAQGSRVVLMISPPPSFSRHISEIYFFPDAQGVIDHGAKQEVKKDKSGYRVSLSKAALLKTWPDRLQGVLVPGDGTRESDLFPALRIDIPIEKKKQLFNF